MVRTKSCRLTHNPQLGDSVAWLSHTLAEGHELDAIALHCSPGGQWFLRGRGWRSAELAAMVGRAMRRAADVPDDRLRHETRHDVAGPQAMRGQGRDLRTFGPGVQSADLWFSER
jgi:hypothetical protein